MNTQNLSAGDLVRVMWAGKWEDGEVVAIHNGEPIVFFTAWASNGDKVKMYEPAGSLSVEPRVSEEELAVAAMMIIYHANPSVSVRDAMRDIYRAGYRKQTPSKS